MDIFTKSDALLCILTRISNYSQCMEIVEDALSDENTSIATGTLNKLKKRCFSIITDHKLIIPNQGAYPANRCTRKTAQARSMVTQPWGIFGVVRWRTVAVIVLLSRQKCVWSNERVWRIMLFVITAKRNPKDPADMSSFCVGSTTNIFSRGLLTEQQWS